MTNIKLDNKDLAILDILQSNGRIAISDLAERVSLSDTPCLRRVKKLQDNGVIQSYGAHIPPQALGFDVLIYAFVRLSANSQNLANDFEQRVANFEQVIECSVISGAYDYLLKVIAKDLANYESFVKQSLGSIAAIASIESTVVLKQTFSKNTLPTHG